MHRMGDNTIRPLADCLAQIERGRAFTRSLRMETKQPPAPLTPALLDAVALFDELHIRYALIGGMAAMLYGRARYTEDIDFVAEPGHEATLAAHTDAMRRHHFDPASTWKLYHDSGVEIDIWKDAHATDLVAHARSIEYEGRRIRVADPTELAAMKLRADRLKDDYDIGEMIASGVIDEPALGRLVTADQFARYLAIKQRANRPTA
jgi:hypothetical protein